MEEKKRICHIQKGSNGFGFILCCENDTTETYVLHVMNSSPACVAGLKPGDRIIEVNGLNVEKETHKDVVQRLQDLQSIRLLVAHNTSAESYFKQPSNGMTVKPIEACDNSLRPKLITVTRNDQGFDFVLQSFGKSLTTAAGNHRQPLKGVAGHFVESVRLGGVAHTAGLRKGHRIIAINGTSVEQETHAYLIAAIKSSTSIDILVVDYDTDEFFRRHGVAPSSKHLTGTLDFSSRSKSSSSTETEAQPTGKKKNNRRMTSSTSDTRPQSELSILKSFRNMTRDQRKYARSTPDLSKLGKNDARKEENAPDDNLSPDFNRHKRSNKAKKEIKRQLSKLDKRGPAKYPGKVSLSSGRNLYDEVVISDEEERNKSTLGSSSSCRTESKPLDVPKKNPLSTRLAVEDGENDLKMRKARTRLKTIEDEHIPANGSPPPGYEPPRDLSCVGYNIDLATLKDRVGQKTRESKSGVARSKSKLSDYSLAHIYVNSY
ncbi:unnamed protein product [Clavelina lepadiformis]|uniref:PDZ domain-containing protein n=1 Tax=Clavelina lepadiformis TaxID=159417 RepID=A0ABP0G2G0_CLALP